MWMLCKNIYADMNVIWYNASIYIWKCQYLCMLWENERWGNKSEYMYAGNDRWQAKDELNKKKTWEYLTDQ